MMSGSSIPARLRRTVVPLVLAATCTLALATSAQAASARTALPAQTPPSHTIAAAQQLTIGDGQSGGGGPVDFWLIKLTGGDQVQLNVQEPGDGYSFDLYAPSTTDANFVQAAPVDSVTTNGEAQDFVTLQAPYNGTFILAVCENVYNYCGNTDNGYGTNPMNPYTFTPTIAISLCGSGTAGEVQANSTIAGAPQFSVGNCQAGGGGAVDLWQVHLSGGDQVQFYVQEPGDGYSFDLYAPGTTDANFVQAAPVDSVTTNGEAKDYVTLQAPYNGTFILAVCENVYNYCGNTVNGYGTNPMNPYTFTPTYVHLVAASVAANETQASPTIAGATPLTVGNFEAGGGGPVDLWQVRLTGGEKVQFSVQEPGDGYSFDLYPPGTTDSTFLLATPADTVTTNGEAQDNVTLQAPSSGLYVLAVCENVYNYCGNTVNGYGTNPMNPYTFTLKATLIATTTGLRLSASVVTYGKETALKFRVTVKASVGGPPRGTVTVRAGSKKVCTITLSSSGTGTCSPSSNRLLSVGSYWVTASYGGNTKFAASKSRRVALKIARPA